MAETTKHPFGWFAFSDRQAKNPASRDQTLVNPGSSQIPFPVKIFCVFPNPVPYRLVKSWIRKIQFQTLVRLWLWTAPPSSSLDSTLFFTVSSSCPWLSKPLPFSELLMWPPRYLKYVVSTLSPFLGGDMRCQFLIECHEVGLFRLNVQANVSCCLPKIGHEGLPLPCMSQGRCRNLW